MTDVIDDEMDKFTKEKADEAAFHPEHVIREGEPGYDQSSGNLEDLNLLTT